MKRILFCIGIFIFFIFSGVVHAAPPELGIKQPPGAGVEVANESTGILVGRIVNNSIALLFTVAAVAFVTYFLWGTVEWIMSGGDKEALGNARRRIITAIIGLVLISLAFVFMKILSQVTSINLFQEFSIPSFSKP